MAELSNSITRKRQDLLRKLASYGRVAVAFSAGVDSTVVAMAAQLACGEKAVAVTARSPSLASGELEEAQELARRIGIRHQIIETQEFEVAGYVQNAGNRCYFCKTELYTQLENLLPTLDIDVMVNGANLDDRGDYRPGMQAAQEHAVRSPLIEAGFTKQDVRDLARHWDLPVWDKPATPCLSSRIAYGMKVTPERVQRVDAAEQFLRKEFGLRELRVRHEANDLARIEVPAESLAELLSAEHRTRITARFHELGFKYVTLDLDGFRSGSMNAVIDVAELKILNT